jgi:Ser/Thr protein kinase RdoA (MazF antagonist)
MIPLSQMKAMFATTDERYRSPLVEPVMARWQHDPGSQGGMMASSNFVTTFKAGGCLRFLRLSVVDSGPFQRHGTAQIEAELAFLRWLGAKGLRANQPVRSAAGRWVEEVETPLGTLRAVVFEAVEGESCEFDEMPPERYPAWGRAIAEYHNAAQGYHQPGRPTWRDHLAAAGSHLPPADALAHAVLDRLTGAFERLAVSEDNYGLIHYDLCADNLFWREGQPGYIDFDDSGYDWFAADLAYAVRDMLDDRASRFDPSAPAFQAVLGGYRQARPLPDASVALIPLFFAEKSPAALRRAAPTHRRRPRAGRAYTMRSIERWTIFAQISGSSTSSLTRTRNCTASRPSTMR